jgi:hypothetical protein
MTSHDGNPKTSVLVVLACIVLALFCLLIATIARAADLTLTWDPVSSATGFEVYHAEIGTTGAGTYNTGPWTLLGKTSATEYVESGVTAEKAYMVMSVGPAGRSDLPSNMAMNFNRGDRPASTIIYITVNQ